MNFTITHKIPGVLGRAGTISTPHGDIQTPAFVTVGTKAAVKAVSPEQVKSEGSQVVLANTYHLYLEPGDDVVREGGGLGKFMNWPGPTMTDSGGFQVFSLGAAFDKHVSKVVRNDQGAFVLERGMPKDERTPTLVKISEEGVRFKSYLDGSEHFFTPERSMEIQWNLGADIMFAFDECTDPTAPKEYQKEAMDRTHRWAKRSLDRHEELDTEKKQAIFGVVQGGRYEDLRKESAQALASMPFDGYGIGGSFEKEDMGNAVRWVNEILPESKPRHLLGIGEPVDMLLAVEQGIDTFDCVIPTRLGRNGTLFTRTGKLDITKSIYKKDFSAPDSDCDCYTCANYSKAYLTHLFRSNEMFAGTLGSIHNINFLTKIVAEMREAILTDSFFEYKKEFLDNYKK